MKNILIAKKVIHKPGDKSGDSKVRYKYHSGKGYDNQCLISIALDRLTNIVRISSVQVELEIASNYA